MTTSSIQQRLQAVQARIAETEGSIRNLQQELGEVTQELETLEGERQQYQLLGDICASLDKLSEMGASELFWGSEELSSGQAEQLEHVRSNVAEFRAKFDAIAENRQEIQQRIDEQNYLIGDLNEALDELYEQEEREKYDYLVEREERPLPYRPMIMPWTRQGEDENRFRKSLLLVFLIVMALSGLIRVWELPELDEEEVEVPEHLVKLVKKQKPKPKPPEPKKPEEKKEEKKEEEKKPSEQKPKPTPEETQQARKKAETSGVLAFKDNFSDLLADDVDANLGASANLSNKGAKAKNDGSRDLVMSQAKSSSGGINTASLSRSTGGSAGQRMGDGVSFSRVESGIGTDMIAEDRPLSSGDGPSRTDEEIQIVFDRYKAALYRIYNRELRQDPTLRGRMVLKLTIQPDGSVSAVSVDSSDMDSAALSSKIVARVRSFNFGPKEGVPAVTILYPIDFLPAS
ncbi:MAG TPA: AgmX/PglI C-terminal domain-containing protein [Gammaproteobacteria bacterium]